MFPTLIKLGPITIHSYGLMIAIGFLVGMHFIQRDAQKCGINPQVIWDMGFWSLLLGVLGTRVLHIIMFPQAYSIKDPLGWIAIWEGGLVFQGAIPAVVLYGWWATKHYQIPFWRTADCIMPYIPVGHALGRLGCFLNGCCYGKETGAPWGIAFPRVPYALDKLPVTGSPPYLDHCQRYSDMDYNTAQWSHPVHPTQLYACIGLLALACLLLVIRKRVRWFEGITLPAYLALYGMLRVIIEFFRGDHNPVHVLQLSDQQIFSIAFAMLGVAFIAVMKRRQKTPVPPWPPAPNDAQDAQAAP